MALPKRRHSKARRDKRRSHHALPLPGYTYCTHCDAPIMPHSVCNICGYYKDKKIIKVKEKE